MFNVKEKSADIRANRTRQGRAMTTAIHCTVYGGFSQAPSTSLAIFSAHSLAHIHGNSRLRPSTPPKNVLLKMWLFLMHSPLFYRNPKVARKSPISFKDQDLRKSFAFSAFL
jgi:hypothetical protein